MCIEWEQINWSNNKLECSHLNGRQLPVCGTSASDSLLYATDHEEHDDKFGITQHADAIEQPL